jgi:flagellar basal body-associated protein FliL
MDVLIALLQSIVVLLLASGVYVALVARKPRGAADGADRAPAPQGPRRVA